VMRITQNGFKVNKRPFNGTWEYRASRPMVGKKPVWTWSWTFRGTDYSGEDHYRATVVLPAKGKETVKVDKYRPQ